MIPEAAVEAAAKVTFEHTNFGNPWDGAGMAWKVAYREAARAALEAAAPHMAASPYANDAERYNQRGDYDAVPEATAPHMLAEAWDDGHLVGWNEATANSLPERESIWRNPYRTAK